jgi:multidrug efflux pump subunit AcrA (membrane-fusion protein)
MERQNKSNKKKNKVLAFIEKFPITSFGIVLLILIAFIVAGQFLKEKPQERAKQEQRAKEVDIFSIGKAPKVRTQAEIEKSGVVKMVAQAGGVIQKINVQEGQEVWRGTNIVWISTNYQGGTVQTVQRQKAGLNYQFKKDVFEQEKELIDLNREQAEKNYENTIETKKIQDKSEAETREVIDLNNDILGTLNDDIEELETMVSLTEQQEQTLLGLKQQKSQLLSTNNQLKQSLRTTEYQTKGIDHDDKTNEESNQDEDNDVDAISKRLSEIQRDKALKQLDLEEKSKELSLEISRLDLTLAQIQEALMYPSSPVNGTVERIFVKEGQVVNPGEVLAMVTATDNSATAVALVSSDVAKSISYIEPSILGYNGNITTVMPSHVTSEPIDGTLHAVIYNIPDTLASHFSNGSFIDVEIPVGNADTISTQPFIPIDSVYQTQDGAYVYVVGKPKQQTVDYKVAKTKEVGLGKLYGGFVEVVSGLQESDQVILDRNVVENDKIKTKEEGMMDDVNEMPNTGGATMN